jgi:hypothetical protein
MKETFQNGIRHLSEIRLWEVSLTPFPMNEMAVITSVKNAEEAARRSAEQAAIARAIREFRSEVKRLR